MTQVQLDTLKVAVAEKIGAALANVREVLPMLNTTYGICQHCDSRDFEDFNQYQAVVVLEAAENRLKQIVTRVAKWELDEDGKTIGAKV